MNESAVKKAFTRISILVPIFLILAFLLLFFPFRQENPRFWEDEDAGCTSIQVGRLASTDGSVMTAHSCDGNFRTWLNIVPVEIFSAGLEERGAVWAAVRIPDDHIGISANIPRIGERILNPRLLGFILLFCRV